MKRANRFSLHFFSFALFAAFTVSISGCDKVVFPLDEVSSASVPDTLNLPIQKILIEDYTGQGCGNCPAAALNAAELQNLYPDQVIVIAVHAGPNALPPYNPYAGWDLTTPEGTEHDAFYGISSNGNSNGLVMRTEYNGATIVPFGSWGSATVDYLDNHPTPTVDIELAAALTGTTLEATVDIDYLETIVGDYNLVLSVTENNVEAPQLNYSGSDPAYASPDALDYVHRHVLRGNMNSTWGSTLITGTAEQGTSATQTHSLTVDPSWNTANLSVVAYIRNATTGEVIQVEEHHVD